MTQEHTPGPWIVNYRRVTPANGQQNGLDDVCHVYGDFNTETANARLIAAAPDMLAVLQQTLRALSVLSPETHDGLLGGKIRAAITKATGKES